MDHTQHHDAWCSDHRCIVQGALRLLDLNGFNPWVIETEDLHQHLQSLATDPVFENLAYSVKVYQLANWYFRATEEPISYEPAMIVIQELEW
jgi:hypothetical protein